LDVRNGRGVGFDRPWGDDRETAIVPRVTWRHRAVQVHKNMPLWQELPLLLVVAFCLAVLIRTFLFQAFFIPSGSMQKTLEIGDRVLVNKVVYDTRQPARGDIIVFRGTDNWAPEVPLDRPSQTFLAKLGRTIGDLIGISQPGEKDFIKRVIGLPGDTVECCDAQGRVMVNGHPLDEPYVTENSAMDAGKAGPGHCGPRAFDKITVAPGDMWVMGDHRLVSQDSRCSGQVPIANVIGKAFVIVWPHARWDTLGTPATFADVPKPAFAGSAPRIGVDLRSRLPARTRPIDADAALVLPILASLVVPARSRLFRRVRPRRLRA
jgi:signal peptidase I